jgi:hypothetical protein
VALRYAEENKTLPTSFAVAGPRCGYLHTAWLLGAPQIWSEPRQTMALPLIERVADLLPEAKEEKVVALPGR